MPLKKLSHLLFMGSGRARKMSKAWLRLCLGVFLMALVPAVWAVTPADENYDDNALVNAGTSNVFDWDGVRYTLTGSGPYRSTIENSTVFSVLGNNGADHYLLIDKDSAFGLSSVKIEAVDGSAFRLSGFSFDAIADANITVTPSGGSALSYTSNGSYVAQQNIDTSSNTDFQNITSVTFAGANLSIFFDDLNFEPAVLPAPTITSATYNASTGALVVTGTNFTATAGATNDVVANKFTLTGEGGATYTLTNTADVEISSATSFTLTLSATDRAGVNPMINKNGSSSTGGTSYNLSGAAGFIANSPATADLTANAITVSSVPVPTISTATYNASTGVLTVSGAGFSRLAGATNDIVANKFTLHGETGATYTLTDTSNVEITSNTSFLLTFSETDKAAYNLIANKNGGLSTDISTYYLNAADDWAAGADSTIDVEDSLGNNITVTNVPLPTISSALYNATTGVLAVTGAGFTSSGIGGNDDIIANKFTLRGEAGATYTLTDTASVDVTSGTSFTFTLSATDKSGVNALLNKNGISSVDGTTYNLAAAEDWAPGADSALIIADLTGNGITVSNVFTAPGAPTIGTATAGDTQVSVTFSAPGSDGGSAITGYTVTASPGGASASGAGSPLVVTGLTNGVAYTFTVTATNGVGTGSASAASNSATPKAAQTITFSNPGTQNFGTTPTLGASASSSLTPTFSSTTPGVCTITSGGALTFVTTGSCSIDADEAGDGSYLAAATVTRSFSVAAVVPGVPTAVSATAGDTQATVSFTAPAFTGGAAITGYTVTSSPGGLTGTGAGSPIVVTGLTNGVAYTFTVVATNSAGAGSASGASSSITPAAVQTITFNNPGTQNFGTTPTLTASASSSLTPTFTSSTTGVCTITGAGALTFVTAGTCTIDADQVGDGSYLAAATVTQSFTVNDVAPSAPTDLVLTAGDSQVTITFTAPTNTGGSPITHYIIDYGTTLGYGTSLLRYTTSSVATGLTNGTPYFFRVTAYTTGWASPAAVASSSVVPKAAQTITFATPSAQSFGTAPSLSATSNSGLTPIFTSATSGVCSISSGGLLSFAAVGTCTINANEPGNGTYLPAAQVSRSFNVDAALPGVPTAVNASAGDSQASVSFTAPAFNGGVAITGYTVTSSPGGFTGVGGASPLVVTGLTNGVSYTFTVTATNSAGTGAPSAVSNAVTPKATQTITFANPGVQLVGESVNLSASASSGLTPVFSSSTTSVCTTTSGGALTLVAAGTCTITVNQAGNGSYAAATAVSQSFAVNDEANQAPVISGIPAQDVTVDTLYSFTPTASDTDDDTLTFSVVNKPAWASFNTTTGALTGTPSQLDEGVDGGIVISVSDGVATASLPAFDIEVVVDVDPLQPVVIAPTDIELNATGLFTPVTLRQLLGLSLAATQAEIQQLLAAMASDGVSGNSCCTANPEGLNENNTLRLLPGRHEVKWSASNSSGKTGEAVQVINLHPLVSLSKSQIAVRDSEVEVQVILNGRSPVYPLQIPYVIDASTTATVDEHNLVSGVANFTEAGQQEVIIPVQLLAVTGFSDSQLVVRLGEDINAGATTSHVIDIREGNVAPSIKVQVMQGGVHASLVTPTGGPVTVTAVVSDSNAGDTHSFDWSASASALSDIDDDSANNALVFSPAGLDGLYQIQVTVTDSGGANSVASDYVKVINEWPVLTSDTDTDGDGIDDLTEGFGDDNENGIPNYLDNMPSESVLPQKASTTNAFLMECDPGIRCGLGSFALGGSSGGTQILNTELGTIGKIPTDPEFTPVGGIFDFVLKDLPVTGQTVRIVIPQISAIPASGVYRKYQNGRWVNFTENANNTLHSAQGDLGYCPPPGSSDWVPGLIEGYFCVQLGIEDGGPNDDDGLVNNSIADPGGVSKLKPIVPPVEPPAPAPTQIKSKGGGAMNGLWLLLFAGAALLRRRSTYGLTLLLALLPAMNAQADALNNIGQWQLRADVYQVDGSQSSSEFRSALANDGYAVAVANYDVSRTGYHLAAGYRWNHWTYTELGYLDLGDVEVDLSLAAVDTTAGFADSFRKHYPRTAQGVTLAQGFRYDINDYLVFSAELGVFMWDEDVELEGANFDLGSDGGIDPLLGVQVGYRLNDSLVLGVTARRIFFSGQEVDLWGVSTTIGF